MKFAKENIDQTSQFPALFGSEIYKSMPLFSYAEHLFYCGMKQMIATYSGGKFDFYKIVQADVDIEPLGFIPMINQDHNVQLESPHGASETLSYKAACLVVWLFVIEQIAYKSTDEIQQQIYRTMQDIRYCYSRATNEEGELYFSQQDCTAIHKLID